MTIKHWKMTSVSASTAIDGDALEKCCSCHSGTQDLRPCMNTSGMLTITANKVRSTSEITKAHCQAAATEQTTIHSKRLCTHIHILVHTIRTYYCFQRACCNFITRLVTIFTGYWKRACMSTAIVFGLHCSASTTDNTRHSKVRLKKIEAHKQKINFYVN